MEPETTEVFEQADIEKNKTMAGLAYVLFFLPLISCPESRYAKFHANQGLTLLLLAIAGSVILGFIPFLGGILRALYQVGVFILMIMGLLNGLNGKATELPVIGKVKLLK